MNKIKCPKCKGRGEYYECCDARYGNDCEVCNRIGRVNLTQWVLYYLGMAKYELRTPDR